MEYILSIVITVYNKQNSIRKMLDSIISQDLNDCEIILVDDGSTDGSEEICNEYKAAHDNVVVIHQVNAGVSAARNTGLKCAKGKYISFFDSDDYVFGSELKKIAQKIGETDADAIFWGWAEEKNQQIIPKNKGLSNKYCVNTEELFEKVLHPWCGYRGYTWNKAVRTDLVRNLPFDIRFSHCEDLLWITKALPLFHNVLLLDNIVYCHVFNEGSLSHHEVCSKQDLTVFKVRNEIISNMPIDTDASQIAQMAYHAEYLIFISNALSAGSRKSVKLINEVYRKDCEKEYLKRVSLRAKLKAKYLFIRARL